MSVSGFYQPMRQLPAFYGHFCSWWAFRLGIVAGENPKRAWNANYTLWAPQFVAFRPDGIILSPLQHLCWKGLDSIIGFPLHPTIILRPLGHLRGFARPVYLWQGLGIVKWAFRLVYAVRNLELWSRFLFTHSWLCERYFLHVQCANLLNSSWLIEEFRSESMQ